MSPEQNNRRWSGVRYENPDDDDAPIPLAAMGGWAIVGLFLWVGIWFLVAWAIAEWVR